MPRIITNPMQLAVRRAPVRDSNEFRRIWALPRRDPNGEALVASMTAELKLPGGEQTLNPNQALALHDLRQYGGAAVLLPPAAGKTHIGVLAATVLQSRNPLYLCPSNLREPLVRTGLPGIRRHWRVHPTLSVIGFGQLQTKRGRHILQTVAPDLIVVDECQMLSNKDSARGNRILEYVLSNPGTRLVVMTGSPSNRELAECAHLFAFALKENTPLPVQSDEDLALWSAALDSKTEEFQRPAGGVLENFQELLTPAERAACKDPLELLRRGFRKRLALTPGVITAMPAVRERRLVVRSPQVEVPDEIREAFRHLRETASITDESEEFEDQIQISRAAKQLISGFYYELVWPDDVVNKPWLAAQRGWARYVRNILKEKPGRRGILANEWSSRDERWSLPLGLDSMALIRDCCRAQEAFTRAEAMGHPLAETLRDELRIDCSEYRDWVAIKDEYIPVRRAVWLSPYLLDYAERWVRETGGLCWVPYKTFGEHLQSRGIRYFGPGEGVEIEQWRGGGAAASFQSHNTGKNLQYGWGRTLYLGPPASGQILEQSMARIDRRGSPWQSCEYDILVLCREHFGAWTQAQLDAEYAHATFDAQRLMDADISDMPDEIPGEKDDPLWST